MASLLNRLRVGAKSPRETSATPTENTSAVPAETVIMSDKTTPNDHEAETVPETTVDGTALQVVNNHAQIGVQKMEATTLAWNRVTLATLFIM